MLRPPPVPPRPSRVRAALTLIAALLLPQAVLAAEGLKEEVTHFTLVNGMEVVVIEDHRAPVVTHMVWYRAGAADETPGVSGVAHYLEHLLFKGTDTLEPGEFSATVAKNGGTDNAFTGHDYTAYFQRVAADRLELMMRMESDRMVNIRLDEEDILTERDVVMEERNQRTESNPSALFNEQLDAAQYLNHRYGVPVIGWKHEVIRLTLADALAYYRTYYAPNNAILVVAGDVQPEEVRRLAETYYGVIPANPDLPERARAEEPPQLAERRLVMRDARVSQPWVSRSYLAPERDSGAQEKAAALTILAEVLGGGQTSVLAEKMQFDSKSAVYTAAYYRGGSLDDTTFNVIVVPAEGVSVEEAEAEMDAVLAAFLEEGIEPGHMERIKQQLEASQIYALDNVESRANRYGRALTQGLTVADVQAWPEVLQSVTEAQVMAAAREVFDRNRSVTGYLLGEQETSQ